MDILIPNLELPLEERIQLSIYPNGLVVNHSTLDANNKRNAVALPSHGRLIDADAIISKIERMVHPDDLTYTIAWSIMKQIIAEAPTVLEASNGHTD